MPHTLQNALQAALSDVIDKGRTSEHVDKLIAVCGDLGLKISKRSEVDQELIPVEDEWTLKLKSPESVFHGEFGKRVIFGEAKTLDRVFKHYLELDAGHPEKRLFTPLFDTASGAIAGYHILRYKQDPLPDDIHPEASVIVFVEIHPLSFVGRSNPWDIRYALKEYYRRLIADADKAELYIPVDGILRYVDLKTDKRTFVEVD